MKHVPSRSAAAALLALTVPRVTHADASAGNGTSQHLAIELGKTMKGLAATHVPSTGGAPAVSDVVGGQVLAMMAGMPTALPSIKAAKLRAIAVTTPARSPNLPQTPSFAEAGIAGDDVTNPQPHRSFG